MSYDRCRSSVSIHPYRLSYLTWNEAPVSASTGNVSIESKSVNALASDTGPDTVDHLKPTRPARHPRRPTPLRIAPKSPPSFDSNADIDDSHSSIFPTSDRPKDPSERIIWLSPASPSSAPSFPSLHTSFLDRIPKPIIHDDDSASSLSSTTSRLPSVPPLYSYKRSLTSPTRDPSDEIYRSLPSRLARHDLVSTSAGTPALGDSPPRIHFLNLPADGKKTVLSPLSFMRMRTTSEVSFSPPVTASTLTNESVLSFIVGENGASETDPTVKTKHPLLWKLKNRSRAQVNLDVYEEALPEPKPGFLNERSNSMPDLAPSSGLRLEIRPEEEEHDHEGAREEDTKMGEWGFDVVRHRTRGVVRRVWRKLVGGQ